MSQLDGKTAVVTGAASGIGKEIAIVLAKAGAAVAIADLNLEGANAVAEQIKAGGGKAIGIAMNVTDEDAGQCRDREGRCRIRLDRHPHLERRHPDRQSDRELCVFGLEKDARDPSRRRLPDDQSLAQAYVQGRRGGIVIYMGSAHSHEASPLKSAYVTAKHGLLGLARTLAKEGAKHNVRSHVICPGFVRTPLVDKQIPEQAKELDISEDEVIKKVMLGNTVDGVFTTVDDVAQTVLFLSTFPTAALTGQSFLVSHGWYMQ